MDFDKEDNHITLLLLIESDVTNLLSILPKLRQQLTWVKPWLKQRSTKVVITALYRS